MVCPTCGAKGRKPCVRIMGPQKGTALSTPHFMRAKKANAVDPLAPVRYVHGGCASFWAPRAYKPTTCPFCGRPLHG